MVPPTATSESRIASKVPLVVGVTGHRDIPADELPAIRSAVRTFLTDLQKQFPDLPLLLLTSLAEGADTLVAEEAQGLEIDVLNVLPMPRQMFESDFSGESLTKFKKLCDARQTIELGLLEPLDQEKAKHNGPERDRQYQRLGSFLAAHSHILLAIWDGKYNGAAGGTGQVVDFHQRDVTALADDDQVRSRLDITDDESDLVYHIACSRSGNGRPANGLAPGSATWFTRDDTAPRRQNMPSRYVQVLRSMEAFNRDTAALPPDINLHSIEPEQTEGTAGLACAQTQRMFGLCDALASSFQKRVLLALRITLGAALAAGLSFILYADFSGLDGMIWGYLLMAATAVGSYLVARRFEWQRRYLDYRVLAEALRVQYYWTLSGVTMNNPSRYSHDSFFQGRDLQLGWIRNVMRFTGIHADGSLTPPDVKLEAVVKGWIGDEQSGQLGYYTRKAAEKLNRHKRTQRVVGLCFALGVGAAFVLAVTQTHLNDFTANALVALMGLLPILAAARQNYAHRLAERELVAQYAHMRQVLDNAHRLIAKTDSTAEKQAILRDLGEAALSENAQWVLRQRERPLPGGDAMS